MKRPLSLVLLTTLLLASLASAEDQYIHIRSPLAQTVNKLLPVAETGKVLYDTQEGAHDTVTAVSGEEIEHYYINVCTEDECIPVDPFRVRN
jgi:hypothetical protein